MLFWCLRFGWGLFINPFMLDLSVKWRTTLCSNMRKNMIEFSLLKTAEMTIVWNLIQHQFCLKTKCFVISYILFNDNSANYAWVFISGKCYEVKVSKNNKSKIFITTYVNIYLFMFMYIFHIYVYVFGRRKAMLQNLRLECNIETRAHSLSFLSPYCM